MLKQYGFPVGTISQADFFLVTCPIRPFQRNRKICLLSVHHAIPQYDLDSAAGRGNCIRIIPVQSFLLSQVIPVRIFYNIQILLRFRLRFIGFRIVIIRHCVIIFFLTVVCLEVVLVPGFRVINIILVILTVVLGFRSFGFFRF